MHELFTSNSLPPLPATLRRCARASLWRTRLRTSRLLLQKLSISLKAGALMERLACLSSCTTLVTPTFCRRDGTAFASPSAIYDNAHNVSEQISTSSMYNNLLMGGMNTATYHRSPTGSIPVQRRLLECLCRDWISSSTQLLTARVSLWED